MTKEIRSTKLETVARRVAIRASPFGIRHLVAGSFLRHLDKLDLVTFGRVNEGNAAAVRLEVRTIGVFHSQPGQMSDELLQALDLESQVRQIRLHFHRAAGGEVAKLD